MPLYELFCLAKPKLLKSQLAEVIKIASRAVIDKGGIITDIKSFGKQPLAYEIRRPGEKYSEASMWQFTFASSPNVLQDIDHSLRVDERVLRWAVLKRRKLEPLPNPYRIARAAESISSTLNEYSTSEVTQIIPNSGTNPSS